MIVRGLAGLLVCFLQSSAAVGDIIAPSELNGGDSFRIVFITSGNVLANNSDIDYYDSFVTAKAAAAGLATFEATAVSWQVIGSTPTVNAISRLQLSSPAIYRIDGVKVAASGSDMWDGSILAPINIDENGNPSGNQSVWTGTNDGGFAAHDSEFKSGGSTQYGVNFVTDLNWISANSQGSETGHPVYAISSVLTITAVPELSSFSMFLIGSLLFRSRQVLRRIGTSAI